MPSAGAVSRAPMGGATPQEGGAEFTLTDRDFARVAQLLRAIAGIDMPDAKRPLVYSRLAKRLRALNLPDFKSYIALVEQPGSPEIEQMLVALTTNVTRFYREPHHFDDLRSRILPPLAAKAKSGGRVRIWSAGCSSGQEPYTIAMTLLEVFPEAANYDVKILATDINTKVLGEAFAGVYPAEQLADAPKELVSRFFATEGDHLRATPAVKKLIAFNQLNLMGEWPMKGKFDIIFCRNVVIYFDEETQNVIWKRFQERMTEGGLLYIGHSERVGGPALSQLINDGVTAYRNGGGCG